MSAHSEADLLRGARNLDQNMLVEIYDLYSSGIFAYAYRLMGDANRAEDCVSETFMRFLQALKNQKGPENHLKAYLYRIAHNWIMDTYRTHQNAQAELTDKIPEVNGVPVENQVEKQLQLKQLRSAMKKLTPDQHLVVTLRFIEGWDINQVAVAINRPAGAVKALQHRALAAIQKDLGRVEVDDGPES